MTTKFQVEQSVIHRHTNEMGRIQSVLKCISDVWYYRVQFASGTQKISEDDLVHLPSDDVSIQSLAETGHWGSIDAVRCALAVERIRHSNASTVYAFRNQRVLFQPYQYKPLLKFVESPDRRLLIADEVGLGKTIEAGLILTELEARQQMDAVLVVCPSRLRDKWHNELNRKFDQDFEVLDLNALRDRAEQYRDRGGKAKLRGIVSMQTIRTQRARELLTGVIGSLDLVIVDEAHHARNSSTATNDALHDLCEISDSVVLLSATPVQLGNQDLFSLLNAMRPEEFRDLHAFQQQIDRNAPLHKASAIARRGDDSGVTEIVKILDQTCIAGKPEQLVDPLATQLVDQLRKYPPQSRRDWVAVERQIQDLHPLGTILTRTRKRDVVDNAPERDANTISFEWTPEEAEAYQRLVKGTRSNGWPGTRLGFAQIQRARQAASCLPAAFEAQTFGAHGTDDAELSDISFDDLDDAFKIGEPCEVIDAWTGKDSKFEKFSDTLETIWTQEPDAKVLVFTYFKGTARYLERRLREQKVQVLRIDGDVPSDPRRPERDERGKRLASFKDDPTIKVMISTEVGSEGLDFQFCHHLFNYDLPWNPMVLEQRIGRIDRFGQKQSKIFIHNLVIKGTVEDRILARLYDRIGIFRHSIGALESILGQQTRELQRDYLSGNLDPETAQQRADEAVDAILRCEQELERLSKNAGQLFGHEEYVREQVDRVGKIGQFLSETSMLGTVTTFLKTSFPSVKIKKERPGVYGLRLTDELRMEIQACCRQDGVTWLPKSANDILMFTFDGETAFADDKLELLNPRHPLMRTAVKKLQAQLEKPAARLGSAELIIRGDDKSLLPAGDYFVAMAPLDVFGVRRRRIIEVAAFAADSSDSLDSEQASRLLFQTLEHGTELKLDDVDNAVLPDGMWDELDNEILQRVQFLKQREEQENSALVVRRRNALESEFQHKLAVKYQRLETATRNGNSQMIKPFQGQIDKARAIHQEKLEMLAKQQSVSVVAGDPIALCFVRVLHA